MGKFSQRDYDEWKARTPMDDECPAFLCDHCENPIMVGEEFTMTNEGRVHDDCYEEFACDILEVSYAEAEEEVYYGEDD
jgi:hypothetical protein